MSSRPRPDMPFAHLLALARRPPRGRAVRCAVASGWTASSLVPLLSLFAADRGMALEVVEAPFATVFQSLLEGFTEAAPQVVLVLPARSDLPPAFDPAAEAARWLEAARAASARLGAAVIVGGFVPPAERALGRLQGGPRGDEVDDLRALNAALAAGCGGGVFFHDTGHLAATLGLRAWHDPVLWHHSRHAVSFTCLPWLAADLAAAVEAALALGRKCVVVDLDGTLWGGVVADVGADGLEIGDTPLGEAYQAFQRHLRLLREAGVLLAVCSRNLRATALRPFASRREMVLREGDFAAFETGLGDKAEMVVAIAARLRLRLDALVYVDDDPVERARIRQALPEVEVVEMPADPAGYVRALDDRRLLWAPVVTAEDRGRTASLRADEARESLRVQTDLPTFLRGLAMRARVAPVGAADVARAARLVNKTNQFNVTGWTCTEASLQRRAADGEVLGLWLSDRFGDYGLVSVMVGRGRLDAWVMSCRVLARGVEAAFAWAARRCWGDLRGCNVPTGRNGAVADLFERLGFVEAAGLWTLPDGVAPPDWIAVEVDGLAEVDA